MKNNQMLGLLSSFRSAGRRLTQGAHRLTSAVARPVKVAMDVILEALSAPRVAYAEINTGRRGCGRRARGPGLIHFVSGALVSRAKIHTSVTSSSRPS